jgi:transcriptional regulator with XRE-family HTH domain
MFYICNNFLIISPLIKRSTPMSTSSVINPILFDNLKKLRENMGYTQEFVAKYLDTPREIISFYETGQRRVTAPHLEKLSNLFQVPTSKLKREVLNLEDLRLTCAFRAEGIKDTDKYALAWFQKVVKNYLRIQKLSQR